VIGLGLVGQLTAQILHAAGVIVMGVDLSPALVEKARSLGSIDMGYEPAALTATNLPSGVGEFDAVIVTASARSNDPVELAVRLLRDRGRVVIVGDVKVDVPRAAGYGREVDIRFSRSYGPGRYDREYEERGLDYPIGYVRWTERRNMAAVLELVATGRIDVEALVHERIAVDQAPDAYDRLLSAKASPLGVVLKYGAQASPAPSSNGHRAPSAPPGRSQVATTVNVIGAGSFGQRVLIPGLGKAGFALGAIASARGLSAKTAADQFGFVRATSYDDAIADPHAGVVAIATRHGSHAPLAEAALDAGKVVFVEKPPCLTVAELDRLRAASASGRRLFVGFNRRHAELAARLRDHVRAARAPIDLTYRVSAGALPASHWLNDPEDGGGRLIGEGCHFVDFACWVVGAAPRVVKCTMSADTTSPLGVGQGFGLLLEFGDGSLATVLYTAHGAPALAKEYVEAHAGGRSAILDDFTKLALLGDRRAVRVNRRRDKGHTAEFTALHRMLSGEGTDPSLFQPDPLDSMQATLAALKDAHRLSRDRA